VLLFSNKIILIRYQRFCNPFRKINVKPEEWKSKRISKKAQRITVIGQVIEGESSNREVPRLLGRSIRQTGRIKKDKGINTFLSLFHLEIKNIRMSRLSLNPASLRNVRIRFWKYILLPRKKEFSSCL
jgi:hypothetical protein